MAHLTLAGLSDDGKRLLLVSDRGVEFTLDVDERLKAALRGDHARLGQLEIKMDSALRPRDIQARIRAGETPEAVAQAAHTTVEAIMPFAAPVIAERQHVADNDDATWLVGDAPEPAAAPPVSDDIARARARRAAAAEPRDDDALPLGDDAISMVTGEERPVEAFLDDTGAPTEEPVAEQPAEPAAEEAREDEPPARKPARKRGRASVPSWDEIMFGGGKSE